MRPPSDGNGDWTDWPEDEARACCLRAAIVIYRSGLYTTNCYEGTRDMWCDPGVLLACSDTITMFGECDYDE
jgi:hypothetical protein